jgi:hypothetical protein
MRLNALTRKLTYTAAALCLAVGVGVAGAGSASAVPASGCGSSTSPILVSHPLTLSTITNIGGNLGVLYLGYFGDCRGVYAEIHWNSPEASNPTTGASWLDAHVEGRVYLEDENSKMFGYVSFNTTANGGYTTSQVVTIDKDPNGNSYAAPKAFYPRVDLQVAQIDQAGGLSYGPHACYISGSSHTFSDGGWQNNAGGGYCA